MHHVRVMTKINIAYKRYLIEEEYHIFAGKLLKTML